MSFRLMPRRYFTENSVGRLLAIVSLLALQATSARAEQTKFDHIQVESLAQPAQTAGPNGPARQAADPELKALAGRLREMAESGKTLKLNPKAAKPAGAKTRKALLQAGPENLEVHMRPVGATPLEIKVQPGGKPAGRTRRDARSDEEVAREFLHANSGILRLNDTARELALSASFRDELGRTHLRFQQQWQGLPVWPCELSVHLGPDGEVDRLNGAFAPSPRRLVTRPVVDRASAIQIAEAAVPGGAGVAPRTADLIVYASPERSARLAWKITLEVAANSEWLIVVDALNRRVLVSYNQTPSAGATGSGIDLFGQSRSMQVWQANGSYYLIDTSKPMFVAGSASGSVSGLKGVIKVHTNQGSYNVSSPWTCTSANLNSWGNPDAVSAAWCLSEVYDYYYQHFNRNSFDGQGSSINVVVDVGEDNAYWSGSLGILAFGETRPYAGVLDVVAHEFTHAVISKTPANLVYLNQSGALNEAMADTFAEFAEARTFGQADWVMARQLDGVGFRNHVDPHSITRFGYVPPSRMSEFYTTSQDNGGVHVNCTIVSHAMYLLSKGLPGAVGEAEAERIAYRALTAHMMPQSRFIDARHAFLAAAEELFGVGSPQAQRVGQAFDAVELYDAGGTPTPTPAPAVSSPDATLFVWRSSSGDHYWLARKEDGLGDGSLGEIVALRYPKHRRPSVCGDGSMAAFVDSTDDMCLMLTEAENMEQALGRAGTVHSVAMSSDSQQFGFVMLDPWGDPDNAITLIDLKNDTGRRIPLTAPVMDGGAVDVLFADVMDFSADGQFLVYDAFNEIQSGDGSRIGAWSIYAIDLKTDAVITLIPPMAELDIGEPSMSRNSATRMTFTAVDQITDQSYVLACDLFTGELRGVAQVAGQWPSPCYNGDETAIIYSVPDSSATFTGASLYRQPLQADRLSPQGNESLWIWDGDKGFIYRRGAYTAPSGTADQDGDGVTDSADNCPAAANPEQANSDGDNAGDVCDQCPADPRKTSPGACGCGVPDEDPDADGIATCSDNCAAAANPDQADGDGDHVGDACDACPADAAKVVPGACGCGVADNDSDGDGVANCVDNCPEEANSDQADSDGDGQGDVCEPPGVGCGYGAGLPILAVFGTNFLLRVRRRLR